MRRGRLTESGKKYEVLTSTKYENSDSSLKRKKGLTRMTVNIKKLNGKRTLYKRLKIIKHITECHYWEGIGKSNAPQKNDKFVQHHTQSDERLI